MMIYNPSNWYWSVGGDATNVWSSARAMSVTIDDAEYVAWLAANGGPSPIPTMDELYEVLAVQYPAGSLPTYNTNARWRRENAGIQITSIGGTRLFTSDVVSRNAVGTAWSYMTSKGTTNSISWKMEDGSFIMMTTAQVTTLMTDMSMFVQACFDCEMNTRIAIDGGTITTLAEVDALFEAITNVFP